MASVAVEDGPGGAAAATSGPLLYSVDHPGLAVATATTRMVDLEAAATTGTILAMDLEHHSSITITLTHHSSFIMNININISYIINLLSSFVTAVIFFPSSHVT